MSGLGGRAFILDWFEHPGFSQELHALAIVLNETTGIYEKALIRVDFFDFAYLLFPREPELHLIDRARRSLASQGVVMRLTKVKTMMGYQPVPSVNALMIKATNISSVLKDPIIKSLGAYVEEHTVVSRSRKMTALLGSTQCGWISIANTKIISPDDKSRMSKKHIHEYVVPSWDELKYESLDNINAFTPPLGYAMKIASFDIEVYKPSSRRGGMPDPEDKNNFILCISAVYYEGSSLFDGPAQGKRKHVLHTIYDVAHRDKYLPEGTEVYRYATEYAMIRGFYDHLAIEDPVVILGFNVQSWDFRYIHTRMTKIYKITYPAALCIYHKAPPPLKMKTSKWSSDAFRFNDLYYPDITGSLILDLHKFFMRARPNIKKHSLDFISRTYLGRGKYPVSQERMVMAYESQDSHELSAMAQYNIEDSVLVLDLYLNERIFEETAIEAITTETLIDDLYTKGMQIRALNKLYRYMKNDGIVLTTSPALGGMMIRDSGSNLIGAYVLDPTPGLYEDVGVYDIRSMYPSIMHMHNICYTTFLRDPETMAKAANLVEERDYNKFNWENKSGEDDKPSKHDAYFVTQSKHKGVCTKLIEDQITLRELLKKWSVSSVDKQSSMILQSIQRQVKAVSNSLIGLMAAPPDISKLSFNIAAGVVYTKGRYSIKSIIADVSSWKIDEHGPVIYSDTDSLMVSGMGNKEIRDELLVYLNRKFSPFVFTLETNGRILLLGAKNYIMRHTDSVPIILTYKGVEFSKRSSCTFVTDLVKEATEIIMESKEPISRSTIVDYVKSKLENIEDVDPEDLLMSATVSSAQKSVGGILGRRLRAEGQIIQPGDVLDYIVVDNPISTCGGIERSAPKTKKKTAKVGVTERTATLEELEKCKDSHKIDYSYYKERVLRSVERLLVF